MFTGIVESLGVVENVVEKAGNVELFINWSKAHELKVDQSVSHNGVCLTVVEIDTVKSIYKVIVIEETLEKSNIGDLMKGDQVNIERAMMVNDRLDGHMVQGHVDTTANCISVSEVDGSWRFTFKVSVDNGLIVNKGSVAINGVSLTVAACNDNEFTVAIIPYTREHTNFNSIKVGSIVNIEYDVIGKYVINALKKFKKQP